MSSDNDSQPGLLDIGTRVEVRNDFDGTWSSGFSVEQVANGTYRLRRRSDDEVLPGTFPASNVRRERRRSTWWV